MLNLCSPSLIPQFCALQQRRDPIADQRAIGIRSRRPPGLKLRRSALRGLLRFRQQRGALDIARRLGRGVGGGGLLGGGLAGDFADED